MRVNRAIYSIVFQNKHGLYVDFRAHNGFISPVHSHSVGKEWVWKRETFCVSVLMLMFTYQEIYFTDKYGSRCSEPSWAMWSTTCEMWYHFEVECRVHSFRNPTFQSEHRMRMVLYFYECVLFVGMMIVNAGHTLVQNTHKLIYRFIILFYSRIYGCALWI